MYYYWGGVEGWEGRGGVDWVGLVLDWIGLGVLDEIDVLTTLSLIEEFLEEEMV